MKILASLATVAGFGALALASVTSGLNVGENISPFHPTHLTGKFAGTKECPPCNNGERPQTIVFVNGDTAENMLAIAKTLDKAMARHAKHEFRAYVVNLVEPAKMANYQEKLGKLAADAKLKNVGIALLDRNSRTVQQYKLNMSPEVRNTVFVYENWKVTARFVNLQAGTAGMEQLNAAIDRVAAN